MSSHGASEMDPKHLGYQPPRPLLQRLQNIESQVFTAFERCSLSLPQNQRDNSHGGRINLGKLSYALAMTRKVLADHEEILLRTKWSLVIDQQRLGWKQSSSKDNSSDHLIDRYEPVIQRHEVNQERIKRLLEKGEQVYAQKRTEIKGLQQRVTQAFENDETSNEYQRTPSGVDMDDDESSIQYPKGDDNEEEDEKVDELSYQRRVSSSLQRTKALMSQEMERMSSLANVLEESGEYLSGTVEEHHAFGADTSESQQVLRHLRRENMIDRAVIGIGLTVFALTVMYIWLKRFGWFYGWAMFLYGYLRYVLGSVWNYFSGH